MEARGRLHSRDSFVFQRQGVDVTLSFVQFFVTDGAWQQASLRGVAAWVKLGAGGEEQVSQVELCYASCAIPVQ